MKIKDQLNREISFIDAPKRIVSLVPSQTELLVDMGLENHIVGVTKFCVHPNHIKKTKTVVGGTKDIKIDKIKELQPDIILCNKEENTQEIVKACEAFCPVHVSDIFNIKDSLELITMYGQLFDVKIKAENLVTRIESEIDDFKDFIKDKPTKQVAYFIWKNPWMVAANDTYINRMLKINKFENVFENISRYPEINIEDLQKKRPELVLLSSEPYPFKEKHIAEISKMLPNAKIMLVDGEAFSWYGSHVLEAFSYFKKLHGVMT